jgi:ParB-like chromosome segregation protein Spo0J
MTVDAAEKVETQEMGETVMHDSDATLETRQASEAVTLESDEATETQTRENATLNSDEAGDMPRSSATVAPAKRGRGRPPGSKNKPKPRGSASKRSRVNRIEKFAPDHPFEIHPLCAEFPLIVGAEFEDLVNDIRQHGQREPITVDRDGRILDGRNRWLACKELGIHCKAVRYTGKDPAAFVWSLNVQRRHLSAEQKREQIARRLKHDPSRSDRAVAKDVGADHKTAAAVRADLEARGEIPHVDQRTDTKGRKQPAQKRSEKPMDSADRRRVLDSRDDLHAQPLGDAPVSFRVPRDPNELAKHLARKLSWDERRELIIALAKGGTIAELRELTITLNAVLEGRPGGDGELSDTVH